jgi:cation:H+ antiporter
MATFGWVVAAVAGVGVIVWGAEAFAEHLSSAAVVLGVSAFALALLLAGAEPEELATGVIASARHVPALAFGDVIGANVAMCLVALGVGAWISPLPFGARVRRYGMFGLPLGVICVIFVWSGHVSRIEGAVLVALYAVYIAVIWKLEGAPPAIGEAEELEEAREHQADETHRRVGPDVALVLAGVVAMAGGGLLLVEGIRHVVHVQDTQTRVGLTILGFATAFELVVLAWSTSRRGASEAAIAAVVGSFAYNATMTLGAAALVRPLAVSDAGRLHLPGVIMLGSLALVLALGWRRGSLGRGAAVSLLACYPVFVVVALLVR